MTSPVSTTRTELIPRWCCIDCSTALGPLPEPIGRGAAPAEQGHGDVDDSAAGVHEAGLEGPIACTACGRKFGRPEGILHAMAPLSGRNRIAEAFYNGPRFERFRFWENLFLSYAGGRKGARRQILRHLPPEPNGWWLKVGIGDGDNLSLLDPAAQVAAVDIAWERLRRCRAAHAGRALVLALAEGECLPFADDSFQAVYSVGGYNFYSNPAGALGEMVRVARPGGLIVVADEYPSLPNRMISHWIGLRQFDRWFMSRVMRLGPKFTEMVERHRHMKLEPIFDEVLEDWKLESIWSWLGYVVAGRPKQQPQGDANLTERKDV